MGGSAITQRISRGRDSARTWCSIHRVNQALMRNAPELLLMPIIPYGLSLLTVLWGTAVLNTASLECVQPLDDFVRGDVVFAFFILIGYAWVLIGPIPITNMLAYVLSCALLGFIIFIWYLVGTSWFDLSSPCVDTAPALYRLVQFKLAVFWIAFIFFVLYLLRGALRWRTRRERAAAKHILDNEERLAAMRGELDEDEDEDEEDESEEDEEDESEDEDEEELESAGEGGARNSGRGKEGKAKKPPPPPKRGKSKAKAAGATGGEDKAAEKA